MRRLLSRLAATIVAAGVAAFAASLAAEPAAAQTIPLTINNQSGYTGKVYVTIYGSTNPAKSNTWYYVSQSGGTTQFTQSGSMKDYGFSFSGKSVSVKIPMLQAARVYVSYGAPILLSVNSDGVPSTPDGWTPGNANFDTHFDFAEYTWVPSGDSGATQIWVDTTQVDFLGIPMRMTLKGSPNGTATTLVGGFNSALAGGKIISAINAAGAPWTSLLVSENKAAIRLVSPTHAMMQATTSPYYFEADYWDDYIDQVFSNYAKSGVSFGINTGGVYYKGTVTNGQMVLTPNNGEPATVFGEPTSLYLWQNGAPFVSGNSSDVATLQSYIQAAFLRSTFLTDSTLSDCSATPYAAAPVNVYSKVIHQYAYNEEAYTFPYDDVCSLSSTLSLLQPTSLSLTLYPLDAQALRRR